MMIIHYEVYVLEPRGWMLHARFPRQEREDALAEAKELEQIGLKVRVVRETYHSDTNTFDEGDIYATGKTAADRGAPERPAAPAARPSAAPRRPAGKRPAAAAPPARKPPTTPGRPAREADAAMTRVLIRLLGITAVGLAAALGAVKVTPDVITWLWHLGMPMTMLPDSYGTMLFIIFVLTFLMVAVPLALRFLPRQANITLKTRRAAAAAAAAAAAPPRRTQDPRMKAALDRLAHQAIAEGYGAEDGPRHEPETTVEDFVPEAPPPAPDPEPQPQPQPEPAPDTPPPPATAAAESNRSALMRFLGGAIDAVKRTATLDAYNRFALHLYLAGGVETLCDQRKLGASDRRNLTMTALETLGTSGDTARRFQENFGEYLLEPRYLEVIQAGRSGMGEFLAGADATAHVGLSTVIRDWNRPADQKRRSTIITVMFTDMVGSTDLTQARGDAAAQEIVRIHNAIVRTALVQVGGREIKHTGDGIMASFPTAAGAAEAAVAIQRDVAAHNRRAPQQELHLRIGLNAGEPIQEEDDLFGTTVQLAARVCAATATDQILCTGVVKDLAFGKGAAFEAAGEHALKGFRDKIALFEIKWS